MKAVGTENAWFSFNELRNDDKTLGVRMLSMPIRPHPARKGKLVDIPGAHGKLFQDEGVYDRILVSLRCIAPDNDNIDAVNAWLSGEGDLIFGDEPNRAYHARITKEFSRSNRNPRLRGQEFTITFDCEPFRYLATPDADIVLPDNGSITNPGTVASSPLIHVEGTGDCKLMIGRQAMTFNDIPGNIHVDCEAKIARTVNAQGVTLLATQHVFSDYGDWFAIEPGYNTVSYTGDVTVTVEPRWRWL